MVLMTAHREFRELDLRRVKERMRTPIVIDGRRVFERDEVRGLGFVYRGGGGGDHKVQAKFQRFVENVFIS